MFCLDLLSRFFKIIVTTTAAAHASWEFILKRKKYKNYITFDRASWKNDHWKPLLKIIEKLIIEKFYHSLNKMNEVSFQIKLKYVSRDFGTNLKTKSSQGNVFIRKEVFITLSLQLIRYTP